MLRLQNYSGIAWSLAATLCCGGVLLACDTKQENEEDEKQESSDASENSEPNSNKSNEQDDADEDEGSPTPSDDKDAGEDENGDSKGKSGKDDDDGKDDSSEDSKDSEKEDEENSDPRPWFKFFTTSQEGLVELAEDKKNGFGGDLGGLAGADEICAKLAQKSNPGDTKTWRAFLSATAGEDGKPVHAIERVGQGPWHDYNNRLFAQDVKGLLPGSDRRPAGADPQLADMFTDEFGRPISPDTNVVDNHDMLTGSDKNGRLPSGATKAETCNDWTSKDTNLGKPRIGHAWPRSSRSGREWIYDHRAGGCGAGIDTEKKKGNGTPTVGSGGGYGGFYCFAL